jgi:hypothetical protein
MGVDVAHFRDDADLGIAVGNFANEMASLFVTTDGRPPFVDEAVLEGLGTASRIPLTFGLLFFDYDLDGREDLLLANGHLEHEIHKVQQSQHYAQPPSAVLELRRCLPRALRAGRPTLATWATGAGPGRPRHRLCRYRRRRRSRRADHPEWPPAGAAAQRSGRPGHHWLRVELTGRPPNTDAIGARLEPDRRRRGRVGARPAPQPRLSVPGGAAGDLRPWRARTTLGCWR